MGKRQMHTDVWLVNLKEGNHLEDLNTDWKIILKINLYNLDWRTGLATYGSGQTQLEVLCDHDDKYVDFIRRETLLSIWESINLSRILLHRINWSSDNSEWDLPPVRILNGLFYTTVFKSLISQENTFCTSLVVTARSVNFDLPQ